MTDTSHVRLWLVASVWVMLHMQVKVHSPTPRTGPSQSGTSHWVSWHHAYINLLTVIAHAQQLQTDIVHGQTDTCSLYVHFSCETGTQHHGVDYLWPPYGM